MTQTEDVVQQHNIHIGAMRIMFALTAVAALPCGWIMMLAPELFTAWLGGVFNKPLFPGAYGSCLTAFGVLSALGFRSPIKYASVLFFQFTYKWSWILLAWLTLMVQRRSAQLSYCLYPDDGISRCG